MKSKLVVHIDKEIVGHLWLDERKRFCFQYEKNWLATSKIPLSLSLPLRDDPYLDDESHSFFANLLPEQKIREVIARNLGISTQNDFGLLEKIGGDCAGAVSVFPEGVTSSGSNNSYRKICVSELKEIVLSLPQRPLLAGEKGIRLSLAGAQKKLPVYLENNEFHIPCGAPSNYIIKPPIEGLDGTVENEAFCMALAKKIGLDVPKSFIYDLDGLLVFMVERYDRTVIPGGIARVHQEDFCQALNVLPDFKYEAEGGPTLRQCFTLIREKSIMAGKDFMSLLDWVIFNYLIGNSDAHGKNISLIFTPEGPRLAPFYDLLSTRIYAHYGLAEGLAMKIGGENNPDEILRQQWDALAEDLGIKPKFLAAKSVELSRKIEDVRLKLFKGSFAKYKCDALYRLNEFIAGSCEKILESLYSDITKQ